MSWKPRESDGSNGEHWEQSWMCWEHVRLNVNFRFTGERRQLEGVISSMNWGRDDEFVFNKLRQSYWWGTYLVLVESFHIFQSFSSLFLHVIIIIYMSFCHCTRCSSIVRVVSYISYGYNLTLCVAEARYIFAEKSKWLNKRAIVGWVSRWMKKWSLKMENWSFKNEQVIYGFRDLI